MSIVTIQRSPTPNEHHQSSFDGTEDTLADSATQHFSEYYFCVKGTAVILAQPDRTNFAQKVPKGEIEEHLQAMLEELHADDTLFMAVKLESNQENSISLARYLAVVSSSNRLNDNKREVVVIGFDCFRNSRATFGVVIPISSATKIQLDGDGGIVTDFDSSLYLFRPVSVQAMWTIFQCLHREKLECEKFMHSRSIHSRMASKYSSLSSNLTEYYRNLLTTDDSLLIQWQHTILDSYGPESKGDLGATCADAERFNTESTDSAEAQIYSNLKEVMQTVDLDEVTSKDIRLKVQENMGRKLDEYKDFISRQMLVIMGQLDKASQIFPYLYLGTEWNACDWNWLQANGVRYIVNVTNEVENFFPARLKYLKIRVVDETSSELLKHWNQTNQFIKEAKEKGDAVLVHCKKGISRSSSTVIAYTMKEYGWDLYKAIEHVKMKRDCITPNKGFVEQLRTFEGMLKAFGKRRQFDISPMPMFSDRCGRSRSNFSRHMDPRRYNSFFSSTERMKDKCEMSTKVKNLVGNFEARGRHQDLAYSDSNVESSAVTFRLSNLSDSTNRRSLASPLQESCKTQTNRHLRTLTIS